MSRLKSTHVCVTKIVFIQMISSNFARNVSLFCMRNWCIRFETCPSVPSSFGPFPDSGPCPESMKLSQHVSFENETCTGRWEERTDRDQKATRFVSLFPEIPEHTGGVGQDTTSMRRLTLPVGWNIWRSRYQDHWHPGSKRNFRECWIVH